MTVGVAIIASIVIAITLIIAATFTIGFALVMYDEIIDRIEDYRSRNHWKEQATQQRITNRNKRIAQLEQELGITDNRRNT